MAVSMLPGVTSSANDGGAAAPQTLPNGMTQQQFIAQSVANGATPEYALQNWNASIANVNPVTGAENYGAPNGATPTGADPFNGSTVTGNATSSPGGGSTSPTGPTSLSDPTYQSLLKGPKSTGYSAAQVANPELPVAAYTTALQQAYAPQFQESQQDLAENLAGMGILTSGSGSKQFQDLTARDNATVASGLLPLIEQGYSNNYNSQTLNAAADNAASQFGAGAANSASSQGYAGALSDLQTGQGNAQQTGIANLNANTGTNNLNAQLGEETNLANLTNAANFNQQQAGYSNEDYLAEMQQLYGLQSSGLTSANGLLNTGLNQSANAYTGAEASANQAAGQIGAASAIPGQGTGVGSIVGYDSNGNPIYNGGGGTQTVDTNTGISGTTNTNTGDTLSPIPITSIPPPPLGGGYDP